MKKLLIVLLSLAYFATQGQVYQNDPSYGRSIDRYEVRKDLGIPTFCGVPTVNSTVTNKAKLAYDSCGHVLYQYDPSTATWSSVSGSIDLSNYYSKSEIDSINTIIGISSQADGRISGGYVTWTGTGLSFNVSASEFRKFGIIYYTNDTTITLDPADVNYNRIDLFALDTSNNGEVVKITGIPSPTPIAPQVSDNQIALTTGFNINVGDTIPSNVSIQKIYDQNVEWATSTYGSINADFNNTTNPFTGTKDILVSNYNRGWLIFTRSGTGVMDGSEVLKLHISLKDTINSILYVYFGNGSAGSSSMVPLTANNGFNPDKINTYQTVTIPISAFTFSNTSYNKFYVFAPGHDTTGTSGFYLDDVELQTGINNIPNQTDISGKLNITDSIKIYVTPSQLADTIRGLHDTLNLFWPLYGDRDSTGINAHFRNDSLPLLTYEPGADTGRVNEMDVPVKKWVLDRIGAAGGGTVTSVAKGYGILPDGTITTTGIVSVDSASLASYFPRRKDSTVSFVTPYQSSLKQNQLNGTGYIKQAGTVSSYVTQIPLPTDVTGILPISNGGTGTATPSIVAGTNITVTGSWPNQTINSSGGGKDSSAYHTSQVIGDSLLVLCDLKGRCDTIAMSSINLWNKNGNKIYYNAGNVGIGTDTPNAKLTIRSNMAEAANLTDSSGIILSNLDSSTATIKPSPPIVLSSYGYKTGAGTYLSKIRMRSVSSTGASPFKPTFYIEGTSDGGLTYSTLFTVTNAGGIVALGSSSFGGINGSFATFSSLVTAAGLTSNSSVQGLNLIATKRIDVGTSTADYSAVGNFVSTNQGLLPPRMTSSQRDSINLVVTGATITNGGSYSGTPTVNFANTNNYVQATGTAVKTGSAVTSITITNGGNYYNTPTITFSGGTGSGATATPIMTQTLPIGLTIFCTNCTATDSSTGVMQTWNGTSWKNNW